MQFLFKNYERIIFFRCKETGTFLNMQSIIAKAILFDLDGTLIDSWKCIEYAWKSWCLEHNLAYDDLVHKFNGSRTVDIISALKPYLDPEIEKAKIDAFELQHPHHLNTIPGARELLNRIPKNKWGIVTSGSQVVVNYKLKHLKIDAPQVLITSERISQGKPHPQGYLKAASLINTEPGDCLVFEDSPQGIKAALSAGMKVIALSTTFPLEMLGEAHACIDNYLFIDVSINDLQMTVSSNLASLV
jgi:sugar-phosphatase